MPKEFHAAFIEIANFLDIEPIKRKKNRRGRVPVGHSHVGLLFNKPLGEAKLLFSKSSGEMCRGAEVHFRFLPPRTTLF